ncbi:uncharacterized protein LOC124372929 [Homalodisca vitripennis]|uniref:uncharacterized protein LOC124372929 n=1 Tax=Homalodisca vitripennis TaxID=197043 RepID=UPI001EECD1FD|nr:uncharacterized protein LOC124372929 [Homalodisca vitripennis]
MLIDFRKSIVDDDKDILPVGNIEERFEKKFSRWFTAKGSFKATGGSAKSLSSILRTGDATVSSTPTSATFTLHLGLPHMKVHYKHYTASFLSVRVSGNVRLTIRRFSMLLVMTLQLNDDNCEAILDTSKVEYLDGLELDISGLGILDWALEKISELVIKRFKSDIQRRLEREITNKLKKEMSKQYMCDIAQNYF